MNILNTIFEENDSIHIYKAISPAPATLYHNFIAKRILRYEANTLLLEMSILKAGQGKPMVT